MKSYLFRCALVLACYPIVAAADVPLVNGSVVHFATASEGRKLLTANDDFIQRLSPFDRSARMKVAHPVSEEAFLAFVGANVTEWTDIEMQTLEAALTKVSPSLRELPLSFPSTIQLIKTTGAEEGNAAYTRATAIVLPKDELKKSGKELEKLICHELFHVLSRQNPTLRDRLYAIIGFTKCDEVAFPSDLKARKITNPDAPKNDHFIRLNYEGHECLAVPILFSSTENYDVQRGGEFFEYLTFQFLTVTHSGTSLHLESANENAAPKLLSPQAVSGLYEQIGRNTQYIIHPEEILADNFALLILGEHDVPSPEILHKMKAVLTSARGASQASPSSATQEP